MSPKIEIYTKENIDQIVWPDTPLANFTKKMLVPYIIEGPEKYICNVYTEMFALKIDDLVLPVSITNTTRSDNCFICSPYNHYITYSLEGVTKIPRKLIRYFAPLVIKSFGVYLRLLKLDKVVIVNNWLFSTNLYPDLSKAQIETITNTLITRFPEHAIAWRSINNVTTPDLKKHLKQKDYQLIVGRKIFLLDIKNEKNFSIKNVRRDRNILYKTSYDHITGSAIKNNTASRLEEIYQKLYLSKYSFCNPQYNEFFFRLMLKVSKNHKQYYDHHALSKEGRIDAVMALYCMPPVIGSPLIGHADDETNSLKLYRMILAMYFKEAKEQKETYRYLHLSAGVGNCKRLRGAVGELEYLAVYYDHLPSFRSLPWKSISSILNGAGKKFLNKK